MYNTPESGYEMEDHQVDTCYEDDLLERIARCQKPSNEKHEELENSIHLINGPMLYLLLVRKRARTRIPRIKALRELQRRKTSKSNKKHKKDKK